MVLLDTQLVLWAAVQPERLPKRVAKLLGPRDTEVAFSVATLWEVAIKTSLARPDFNVDVAELCRWLLSEAFVELPIAPGHVVKVSQLPWIHRDPFERLLVAQAQVEAMPLWTTGAALKAYGSAVKLMA